MSQGPSLYHAARWQLAHLWQLSRQFATDARPAATRFVIFGRGRSGSTALVSLLNSLPNVRCEGEILHHRVQWPLRHVLARSANAGVPVYGCKVLSYQVMQVQPLRDRIGFLRELHGAGFHILYLRRDNMVQQALSNVRARVHGFHARASERTRAGAVHVEPKELLFWLDVSQRLANFEAECLAGVPHLPLTYEGHLADEARQQAAVRAICEHIGIAYEPARCEWRKISPSTLRGSIENYDEIARALAATPYARFLDEDAGRA